MPHIYPTWSPENTEKSINVHTGTHYSLTTTRRMLVQNIRRTLSKLSKLRPPSTLCGKKEIQNLEQLLSTLLDMWLGTLPKNSYTGKIKTTTSIQYIKPPVVEQSADPGLKNIINTFLTMASASCQMVRCAKCHGITWTGSKNINPTNGKHTSQESNKKS